jgi:nucleoside-diphosphate-sugar epimerase
MRVFVAGATGAIGRQLVPRLVAAGHEVTGMTRSESKRSLLAELGAVPVVADALDPDQVFDAVAHKRELQWRPAHASWRDGFVASLSTPTLTEGVTA